MLWLLLSMVILVFTKDFVVPQMALENLSAFEGWRRLWVMLQSEKGLYAGYGGMKLVLAIGAAVAVGILAIIMVILLLIPFGGIGAIAVIAGKAAGFTWNVFTITAAIVAGSIFLLLVFYAVSLISVPVIVFFPAYSIYFFAARYPNLARVMYPAPPPPPPLMPPPIPPVPDPIS
jgi:membrane-anchored glycerophosphoryl diester phosphodiesterase (GDPDase)